MAGAFSGSGVADTQPYKTDDIRSDNPRRREVGLLTGIAMSPVGAVDTIARSIANPTASVLNAMGADIGEIDTIVPEAVGIYHRNRDVARATGEIGVAIAESIYVPGAIVRNGARLQKLASTAGIPASTMARMTVNHARTERFARAMKMKDESAALKSASTGRPFTPVVDGEGMAKRAAGLFGKDKPQARDTTRAAAARRVTQQTRADEVKLFIGTEMAINATLNESDLLFGEEFDIGDVLVGAAFTALPIGAATLSASHTSRTSLNNAQEVGQARLKEWKEARRAEGAMVTPGTGGFSQGYDRFTSTMDNAVTAQTTLEVLKVAEGDDLRAAENLWASSVKNVQDLVKGHNSDRPFQLRSDPANKATGPTGGLSDEQARAVTDALIENPSYTISLSGVKPIAQLGRVQDDWAKRLDEAIKEENPQDRDFWLGHEISVVERDGTIVDAMGKNTLAKEQDFPFAMATRQTDFRDTGSLNVTRTDQGDIRLADHGSAKALRNGDIELHGRRVQPNEAMSVSDATAVRALLEGIDANPKSAPKDAAFYVATPNDHAFKLSWLANKLEDGTLTSAQVGGSNSQQLRARARDQQFEMLKSLAESGRIDNYLPSDLSKAIGWTLHDRNNEYTTAAEIVLLQASLLKKTTKLSDFSTSNHFAQEAMQTAADVGIAPSQTNALRENIQNLLEQRTDFNTRTRPTLRASGDGVDTSASPSILINRTAQRPPSELSQQADALSQQAVRHRRELLGGQNAHWLTRSVVNVMRRNKIAHTNAQQVQELHHSSLKWNNALTTREAQASDSRVLQAVTNLVQETERVIDRAVEQAMKPLARLTQELRKKGNEAILAQHSAYTRAFQSGQTPKGEIVGAGRQEIDMTLPGNRQAVERLFANNPAQAQRLLQPTEPVYMFDAARALKDGQYIPVELDDQAARLIGMINQHQYDTLDAANMARQAVNRRGVNRRTGHIPPENFTNKHMIYFRSPQSQGRVSGFVAGNTEQQAKELARTAQAADPTLVVADDISVQNYMEYYDDIYAGLVTDYRNPLLQTGPTKNTRVDTTVDVSGDLLVGQLESIRDAYRRAGAQARKLEFEQALTYNKRAQEASGIKSAKAGATRFSPWEEYERLVNGWSNIAPENPIAKSNEVLTEGADMLFAHVADKFGLGASGLSKSQQQVAERLYNNGATSQLFSSIDDVFARAQIATPWKGSQLARQQQRLNGVIATATLRFGQIGHGVLNLTSLLVTAPPVARRLAREEGESPADYKARLGGIADYLDDDNATINPTKLMADGIRAMFNPSKELRDAYKAAEQRGYFEAKVMEQLQEALYDAPPGPIRERFDKMIEFGSQISDGSEVMSRRLAWGMGYSLSKRINKNRALTEEDHYSFSHWFASQTIGNYDPRNRPDVFRGVSGVSAGLFQTFVLNYMQRLINMVEKKEHRTLMVQGITQTGMFGLSSIPGYDQLNGIIGNQHDDEENLTDRLYRIYGKDAADVVWMGTLSNLPKIFPGDQAGIGFYSRGAIGTPQIPNIITGASDIPVVKFTSDTFEMVAKGVNELRATGTITRQRMGELIAAYSPVRAAKTIAELSIGQAVNRNGDLIDGDIHTFNGVVSSLLGSKTADATKLGYDVWRNYGYSQKHRSRVKRLTDAYVGWLRKTEGQVDPALTEFFRGELLNLTTEKGATAIMKNAQDKARKPLADRRAKDFKNAVDPLRLHRMTENDFAPGYEE